MDCINKDMCCIDNEVIDVSGLCDPDKITIVGNDSWTQTVVQESLIIPEEKPDIEQINSVNIKVEIIRKKVVPTPISVIENLEGKLLTGRKLIVEGCLCQTVSYTAAVEKQSVHSAHFKVPFSAFIVLPEAPDPPTDPSTDPLDLNYRVDACVEDLFITQLCPRQIFKNVIVFLKAVQIPGPTCGNCEDGDCCCEEQIIVKGACTQEKLEGMLDGVNDETWTQMFIPEFLTIPSQKPDIEQLISITSRIKIIAQKVIETPTPASGSEENEEGTKLTGKKLIIEGILRQKVVYTAEVAEQSLHSAHFDVPFSAFIVVDALTELTDKFRIQHCIEDIFACKLNKRQIFKNVTFFIKATPLVCP